MPRGTRSQSSGDTEAASEPPTVSIYQNADHVAGLVQQLYNAPLIVEGSSEQSEDASNSRDIEGGAHVGGEAAGAVPAIGRLAATAGLTGTLSRSRVVATGTKSTQSFVYSQAYYLNLVRQALREAELLRPVRTRTDAETLDVGAFVEYEAVFSASILTALMDVLTPDLMSMIYKYRRKKADAQLFDGYGSFEEVQIAATKTEIIAQAEGDLAESITRALKADFRQDKTREYLGQIGVGDEAVTAVTICDNHHFVVEDEDRILDGSYRVLGKVTSRAVPDVPALQRNKLLRALAPEGIDALFEQLTTALRAQSGTPVAGLRPDEFIDLDLRSRVQGLSFRVVPIAIYV